LQLAGSTLVSDPKGVEIVKDALHKIKFSRDIKRTEGNKPTKVFLGVSVDSLRLTNAKNGVSYCIHIFIISLKLCLICCVVFTILPSNIVP